MTPITTIADLIASLTDVDPHTKICVEVTGDEGDPQPGHIADVDATPHSIRIQVSVDMWPITELTAELIELATDLAKRKSKDRLAERARTILARYDL